MAWRRPVNKPLFQPRLVYRRIFTSVGLNELKYIELFLDTKMVQVFKVIYHREQRLTLSYIVTTIADDYLAQ